MPNDHRFWKRVAAVAERSDLTHSEVAARHGVSVSALRSWIYRLRRERGSVGSGEPRLLPVRIATSAAVRESLEIVVGEILVRVPTGADPAYVARLLAALRAC